MAVRHFGEAIDPLRIDTVRRRSIDDDGAVVGDQLDRFPCCIVRQAKDHGVRFVQQFCARRGVLAALGIDGDDLKIAATSEPLADLQARSARLAVDENLGIHGSNPQENRQRKRRSGFPKRLPRNTYRGD